MSAQCTEARDGPNVKFDNSQDLSHKSLTTLSPFDHDMFSILCLMMLFVVEDDADEVGADTNPSSRSQIQRY